MARFDVTDAEWALIEPFLPVAATGPLPRRVRDQFNGVLWRFRTGSGWRDVPDRYGPWSTIYSRFSGWARAGVFQDLMDALIAEAAARGQVGLELVSVDSTIVRAHHESAGLAVAGETLDALEQALTEEKGVPLPQQPPVLRVIRRRPVRTRVAQTRRTRTGPQRDGVAADKAYSSKGNRACLRRRRITAVIPEKTDQQANRKKKGSTGGRPVTYDIERYKQRNTVERSLQKIKTWRGLATRHDKSPESYEPRPNTGTGS
ncbi:IS5 family transposase [Streptomyces sp. NBC_01476]|nr:IS5 family transposase [Streptomyces sp. NBC_01476]